MNLKTVSQLKSRTWMSNFHGSHQKQTNQNYAFLYPQERHFFKKVLAPLLLRRTFCACQLTEHPSFHCLTFQPVWKRAASYSISPLLHSAQQNRESVHHIQTLTASRMFHLIRLSVTFSFDNWDDNALDVPKQSTFE